MSFILDALRKSESERQRLSSTAIAELPIGRRRHGQPWWVFALAALLVLNLVVLAVLLLRDKQTTSFTSSIPTAGSAPSATASTPPAYSSQAASQYASQHSPQLIAPQQQPIVHSVAPLQEAAQSSNDVQYETVSRTEMDIANAAASVPAGASIVRPLDQSSSTPTSVRPATAPINDAAATGDLHLDLHVYSSNARDRFVLINMKRYVEGQQLTNGATIEQIVPDGVIIYQNGTRYKLDRR